MSVKSLILLCAYKILSNESLYVSLKSPASNDSLADSASSVAPSLFTASLYLLRMILAELSFPILNFVTISKD